MLGIDLFSGGGGTTSGAVAAGVNMLWAANHNPLAVETHALNHTNTIHSCQDLKQADWSTVPQHNIAFASPCCQGHSKAAGKQLRTTKADASRSTAWAVVDCLDILRSDVMVIENVLEFRSWLLFEPWLNAIHKLGYSVSQNIVNARDIGIPQNRERLIMLVTRSKHPLELNLEKQPEVAARTIIDWNVNTGWGKVSDRVEATQRRVRAGRERYGRAFLDAAYGSELGGRSLDNPLGTVTTINKHSLVVGDNIRSLTVKELARAQSFDDSYLWPKSLTAAKQFIGNAVAPLKAQRITEFLINNG